ncbi:choice-of-anchor J domain-containing protein [Ruminococcus sp. N15.MGS-57]|uniref:choice-of-anchor J domain-containing protein n=1 Tax=Ruminococcus sp. N15.MGS-57 TaxID=1637508 RepID=UPI0006231496|nr:choice-of-anchor J domain-containing protein [Ruminococcus sp. N15.MGS-57]
MGNSGGTAGDTVTLTTTASDGGTVAPAGQTTYVSGQAVDVTFTPDQGYQLASVKVNGRTASVTGNVLTLTMDQSYAVSVVFEKIPDVPTVMFENDFESVTGDSFPFHGWTLKGVNPNGYTWKQYTYYNWKSLGNDTKHAYISDDWNGGAQDEYLISPAVNLTGKEATLSFDYGYGYYGAQNKTYTATVEVSTDGGQTWTALWNFFDSYNGEKSGVVSGRKELAIPAQYAVDGVQFAFHYVNPTHETGPLAVDNVKLTVPRFP